MIPAHCRKPKATPTKRGGAESEGQPKSGQRKPEMQVTAAIRAPEVVLDPGAGSQPAPDITASTKQGRDPGPPSGAPSLMDYKADE